MGDALILKIQSAFIQKGIRAFLSRLLGWDGLASLILLIPGLLSAAAGGESLHMMMAPAGGEGGSGAGSSKQPSFDLNVTPTPNPELSRLMGELETTEQSLDNLVKKPITSKEEL